MHNRDEWDNLSLFNGHSSEGLDTPMTDIERTELAEHEQVIEAGLQTFYEVGAALLTIRDKRLYRSEYSTFEDYCRDRWNMSRRHANRLIMASNIIDNLGPVGPNSPMSEFQTRPLQQLDDPDQQREAWQRAVDTAPDGNVTAGHVQRVVDEMRNIHRDEPEPVQEEDEPVLDIDYDTGEIINPSLNYKRDNKANRAGIVYEPQGYDACQTPPYAIDPLLPYLDRSLTIWEPAAGEGHLVEAYYDSGFDRCVASDMLTGQNFFEYEPDEHWDCIITNPPYSLKYDWLERCYQLGKPFALLVPVEVLGSGKAQTLMQANGFEVMLLSRRVDFKMPNAGWGGAGAQFPTLWLCWQLLPEPVVFGDIPLEVKRAFHSDAR